MKIIVFIFCILVSAILFAEPQKDGSNLAEVELLCQSNKIFDNSEFYFSIEITPKVGWHTYWLNPGDSGLETTFDLTLSKGFKIIDTLWQVPEKFYYDDLADYGYSTVHYITFKIKSPKKITSDSFRIKANIKWLICKNICLPGKKTISNTYRIENIENKKPDKIYTNILNKVPSIVELKNIKAIIKDTEVIVSFDKRTFPFPHTKYFEFYPFNIGYFNNGYHQTLALSDTQIELTLKLDNYRSNDPKRLYGLIVDENKKGAFIINLPIKKTIKE